MAGLPENHHSPSLLPLTYHLHMAWLMEVCLVLTLIVASCFSLLFKILLSNGLAFVAYLGCLLIHHVIAQRDHFQNWKIGSGRSSASCWYRDIFRNSCLHKCLPQHVLQQNYAPEALARAAYLPCFRHSSFVPAPTVLSLWPTGQICCPCSACFSTLLPAKATGGQCDKYNCPLKANIKGKINSRKYSLGLFWCSWGRV